VRLPPSSPSILYFLRRRQQVPRPRGGRRRLDHALGRVVRVARRGAELAVAQHGADLVERRPDVRERNARLWRRSWIRRSAGRPAARFALSHGFRSPSRGLPSRTRLGNTNGFPGARCLACPSSTRADAGDRGMCRGRLDFDSGTVSTPRPRSTSSQRARSTFCLRAPVRTNSADAASRFGSASSARTSAWVSVAVRKRSQCRSGGIPADAAGFRPS
jgi:hypothetical protein